jgi:hypothetical protein
MIHAEAECIANDAITLLSNTLRSHPNGNELASQLYRRLHARLQCEMIVQTNNELSRCGCRPAKFDDVPKPKICKECQVDVSNSWRIKNNKDEYLCESCHVKETQVPELDLVCTPSSSETLMTILGEHIHHRRRAG